MDSARPWVSVLASLFLSLRSGAQFTAHIEQYGAENVAYGEESPDGDDTIVRTRVTLKPSWEVGVDYRMAWGRAPGG